MATTLQVDFTSKLPLQQLEDKKIDDILIFKINSKSFYHFRFGKNILCYEFNNNNWKKVWEFEVFNSDVAHDKYAYPWYITDKLQLGDYQILVRTELELKIIKISNSQASVVATDGLLHDVYGYSSRGHEVNFGSIYPNLDKIGVILKNSNNSTLFYALDNRNIIKNPKHALLNFKKEQQILSETSWKNYEKIYTFDINNQKQESIILRTKIGFEFCSFNTRYELLNNSKLNFSNNENEKILFGNLTNSILQDMLIFNTNGLFIYKWNTVTNSYEFLSFHSQFSQQSGWDIKLYGENVHLIEVDKKVNLVITDQFGISVYQYNEIKLEWSVVLDSNEASNQFKYSEVVGASKNTLNNKLFIIDQDSNYGIHMSQMSIKSKDIDTPITVIKNDKVFNLYEISEQISSFIPRYEIFNNEKLTLLWSQKYDTTQLFKNIVHPITGEVKFTLPLVSVTYDIDKNIDYNLSYNSGQSGDKSLGLGWSSNIHPEFISLNVKQSIFEKDHVYILNIKEESIPLELVNKINNVYTFKISSDPQIKSITYNKNTEIWKFESDDEIKTYGGKHSDSSKQYLHYSLSWDTWNGPGTDINNLKPTVIGWYLQKTYSKFNKETLTYSYINIKQPLQNKTFTKEVLLKKIENNKNILITFNYKKKENNEYIEASLTNNYGKYSFPINQATTHYVDSYCIETDSYIQCIQFKYLKMNKTRLLTGIEQVQDNKTIENILKFTYKEEFDTFLVSEIQLPTNLKIKLKYEKITLQNKNKIIKYTALEKPQIQGNSNLLILSDKIDLNTSVRIRILDRKYKFLMHETVIKCNSEIKNFNIIIIDDNIVYVIKTNVHIKIIFLEKNNKKWTSNEIKTINSKSLYTFGTNFIAYSETVNDYLHILEWETGIKTPTEKSFPILDIKRLESNNDNIVSYNDISLYLVFKKQNEWTLSILRESFAGYLAASKTAMELFNIDANFRNDILDNIQDLHILGNTVCLCKLVIENDVFYKHMDVLNIDANYKIKNKQTFKISEINLLKIKSEKLLKNVTFNYYKSKGLYHIQIIDISGEYIEEINKKYSSRTDRNKAKSETIKHFNKESKDKFKTATLLEIGDYVTQSSPLGILIGQNDTFLEFDGSKFTESKIPAYTIKLKENVILSEIKPELLQIKNNSKLIRNLTLKNKGSILNRYPIYIAYQDINNNLDVISFDKEFQLQYEEVFKKEVLLFESDYESLISFANSTTSKIHTAEPYEIIIRSSEPFITKTSYMTCISEIIYTDDTVERITNFKRQLKNDVNYNTIINVKIIPEGNEHISGFTELEFIRNYETQEWTQKTGIYNNVNELEMEENVDSKPKEEESKEIEGENVIMDQGNRLIIVDISPLNKTDQMIGYIGFEDYEITKNSEIWKYNINDIKNNKYSYTGKNVLSLINSDINATFTPNIQSGSYIITSYVRSDVNLQVGDTTNLIKAIILFNNNSSLVTLVSKVIEKYGEWNLVQIEVDFSKLSEVYKAYIDYHNSVNKSNEPNTHIPTFTIKIVIESTVTEQVDIDNIAFYPSYFDFKALVYDQKTGKHTSVIQYKNTISRIKYDEYENEILAFKDDGSELKLTMSHLTGNSGLKTNEVPHKSIFIATSGLYETFDEYALKTRWQVNNVNNWKRSQSKIKYDNNNKGYLKINEKLIDKNSYLVKFKYNIFKNSKLFYNNIILERKNETKANLILLNTKIEIDNIGNITVLYNKNRLIVWYDNIIIFDKICNFGNTVKFETIGSVIIEDFILLNDPQVQIEYRNEWGENIQVLKHISDDTIAIYETLYDKQGRDAIITKIIKLESPEKLLSYNNTFTDIKNHDSLWKNGILNGDIAKVNPQDNGFSYSRKVYIKSPSNRVAVVGLPGTEHCTNCKYSKKIKYETSNSFIRNLYPKENGYKTQEEEYSDKSKYINVYDKEQNLMASYVHVNNFDHILTTYEYNEKNQIVKVLPPLYHDIVGTLEKTELKNSTQNELNIQEALSVNNEYNIDGKLIKSKNADIGDVEYLYNSNKQLVCMLYYQSNSNDIKSAIFFTYNENNQLIKTSYTANEINREDIIKLINNIDNNEINQFQEYQNMFINSNSIFKNKDIKLSKKYMTYSQDTNVIDELYFDVFDEIIEKRVSVLSLDNSYEFNLKTVNKTQREMLIQYPIKFKNKDLQIKYSFDKLGRLSSIKLGENNYNFVTMEHEGNGQIKSEIFLKDSNAEYQRSYKYSSPGFLTEISDQFESQFLTYTTTNDAKNPGKGNGLVLSSQFKRKWIRKNDKYMRLNEDDLDPYIFRSICYESLKNLKYLDSDGYVLKELVPNFEIRLPLLCRGNYQLHLSEMLSKYLFENNVKYEYSYGNHDELIRSRKSVVSNIETTPLSFDTFSKEISGILLDDSQKIFKKLVELEIIVENRSSYHKGDVIGKQISPIFRVDDLTTAMETLGDGFNIYVRPVLDLIAFKILQNKELTLNEFTEIFLAWKKSTVNFEIENMKSVARQIFDKIKSLNFVNNKKPFYFGSLLPQLRELFMKYSKFEHDIVKIIIKKQYFTLGNTASDMESYEIDANGNHRLFYQGFSRMQLEYYANSNKVKSITVFSPQKDDVQFKIGYDFRGNVIQAQHLGIENINYHTVTQRPTEITMDNGNVIKFAYDAQGERVLKQVYNKIGVKINEIFYFRNEKGQVLYDKYTQYVENSNEITIKTVYLYGERGLLGFIRDDKVYSVFTDHAGSIKLVTLNNQVVAAYDYSPYGKVIKKYGNLKLNYLFTGKEFDEETGLYNFHARLYDPSIGRFYQPDPRSQYFSPYKYAGNSPIATVDPDGEFAFLIAFAIGFAFIGAYLGGAAANNQWNPADWNFKDPRTWLGIIGGGIGGALLPYGFVASSAIIGTYGTVGLGITVSYISAAAANNNNWDFTTWDWEKPLTLNALFQGFGTGSGIVGFSKLPFNFANKAFSKVNILGEIVICKLCKYTFLAASFSVGGGVMYGMGVAANDGNAAFWQWDWSKPSTLIAVINGFDSGFGWPQGLLEIGRDLTKLVKSSERLFSTFKKLNPKIMDKVKTIMKNAHHPFNRIAIPSLVVYFSMSAANEDFDITKWDINSFKTYESVLNGLFMGKDLPNIANLAKKVKPKVTKYQPKIDISYRKMFRDFQYKMLNKITDILYDNFFRNPTPYLNNKKYQSQKTQIENFHKKGREMWKQGKNEIPDILKSAFNERKYQILNSKTNEINNQHITKEISTISTKERELDIENTVPFLLCNRRSKRGQTQSKHCISPPTFDAEATSELIKNPIEFYKKNAVSQMSHFSQIAAESKIALRNGETYKMQIYTDSIGNSHATLNYNNINIEGLEVLYFSTRDKVKINLNDNNIKYIITNELQGCTIYTKYDKATNELELYHHLVSSGTRYLYVKYDPKNNNKPKYFNNENNKEDINLYGKDLYDSNGKKITPDSYGVIPIDRPFYYKDNNNLIKLESIAGSNIEQLIKAHNKYINDDINNMQTYTNKIDYDRYMQFDTASIGHQIEMTLHKFEVERKSPVFAVSPLFYKDNNNNWNFLAQKIYYENINPTTLNKVDVFGEPIVIPLITDAVPRRSGRTGRSHANQQLESNGNISLLENVKSASSKLISPFYSYLSYIIPIFYPLNWISSSSNYKLDHVKYDNSNEFSSSKNNIRYSYNGDINSTLMLADVCIRKITNSEPISFQNNNYSDSDIQACAINTVYQIERNMKLICKKFKISSKNINIDPISLQSNLIKLLNKNDIEKIEITILDSIDISENLIEFNDVKIEIEKYVKLLCKKNL